MRPSGMAASLNDPPLFDTVNEIQQAPGKCRRIRAILERKREGKFSYTSHLEAR